MTDALNPEGWPLAATALLIFVARVADVSLATLRIAFIARGHRRLAPPIALVENLLWLIALGQLVRHVDHPFHYLAFAGGYATGTWVGLYLDGKLALGIVAVQIICKREVPELVEELRERQFGLTTVTARGFTGRVRLLYSVVRRGDLDRLLDTVRARQPGAFISVSDVRLASEGYFGQPVFGPRLMQHLAKK